MKNTYKAPEYLVGSGATIDLFILLMSACISCARDRKSNIINTKTKQETK